MVDNSKAKAFGAKDRYGAPISVIEKQKAFEDLYHFKTSSEY